MNYLNKTSYLFKKMKNVLSEVQKTLDETKKSQHINLNFLKKTEVKDVDVVLSTDTDWELLLNQIEDSQPQQQEKEEDEKIIWELMPSVIEEIEELNPIIEKLLQYIQQNSQEENEKLKRSIHTIKGSLGQAGAKKIRGILHHMESILDQIDDGYVSLQEEKDTLNLLYKDYQKHLNDMLEKMHLNVNTNKTSLQNTVKISTYVIDKMVSEIKENHLSTLSFWDSIESFKQKIKDLDDNTQKVARILREFEIQTEMQIESRSSFITNKNKNFDPLELDKFTKLQEMSRTMMEGISDIIEDRRDLSKIIVEQSDIYAHQNRLISSVEEELHKTRLLPADTLLDRLKNEVKSTSQELKKTIHFTMTGNHIELDRVFLEKIKGPLGHILKNSVVHGIEETSVRIKNNKSPDGHIHVGFKQQNGQVIIEVSDDGFGLNINRIEEKARIKGLWLKPEKMRMEDAIDMVCTPGFSTVDSVSELAGRGVGMDAVKKDILELGGKFEIKSIERKGTLFYIQLPESVASTTVLMVEIDTHMFAIPVDTIEHVILKSSKDIQLYKEHEHFYSDEFLLWNNQKFKSWENKKNKNSSVLLIKDNEKYLAVEVSKIHQIVEVPIQSLSAIWQKIEGLTGVAILPNGQAVFLLDLFKFNYRKKQNVLSEEKNKKNILVVDDSLTVRKATENFLKKNGFSVLLAKNGQEALQILNKDMPSIIIMDAEMPKMDGFECTKNIRKTNLFSNIPIVMITSRVSNKHKEHALTIGVNHYLGKPFNEQELLTIIKMYI